MLLDVASKEDVPGSGERELMSFHLPAADEFVGEKTVECSV